MVSAWHLPTDFSLEPREVAELQDPASPPIRYPALSPTRVRSLVGHLRKSREEGLASFPLDGVLWAVDRVARRFLDPADELRRMALEGIAAHAGFSPPMALEVLEGMARDWTRRRLEGLLESEFADPAVLDRFRPVGRGDRTRALGHSFTLHIGAGTVPGVAVTSMIRALLVKSSVLLKPGRGDVSLPVAFAAGLAEEDPVFSRSVAVAYWPRARSEQTEAALREADLSIVYGDDATVAWMRERVAADRPLIAYRHRMGIGVLGREALLREGTPGTARQAARSVALFDQRGCVSPQVFFVEEGGEVDPRTWATSLATALEELEKTLPSGRVAPREGVALQQLRGIAEAEEGIGKGAVLHGGAGAPWTVLYQPGGRLEPSCLHRTVRILPVPDVWNVLHLLEPWSRHLQTVAIAGLGRRRTRFAEALARVGVSRLTSIRGAPWPPPWWHHDGFGPLQAMVRWTDLEE